MYANSFEIGRVTSGTPLATPYTDVVLGALAIGTAPMAVSGATGASISLGSVLFYDGDYDSLLAAGVTVSSKSV